MSLEELRHRMPALKGRSQAVCDEVEALKSMTLDQSAMLKLADVLSSFRERLQKSAETLDVSEKPHREAPCQRGRGGGQCDHDSPLDPRRSGTDCGGTGSGRSDHPLPASIQGKLCFVSEA